MGSYTAHLGDTMSKYWVSFIKYGQPKGDVAWPRYGGDIRMAKTLNIATDSNGNPRITSERGADARKCEFFEKFIKTSDRNLQKYTDFCNTPKPPASIDARSTIFV